MKPQDRIAGEVAIDVVRRLVEPIHAMHERLGLAVDHLERHVATATGPTPYPWRSLQTLRQDLGMCYLEATKIARRLDELERAVDHEQDEVFDLGSAVELGLRLASHHVEVGVELLVDLAHTPRVTGNGGCLSLLVAQMVAECARSARQLNGSSLSVRTVIDGGWALLAIVDNGAGSARASELGELARELVTPWGGSADAASELGHGCAFEIRLASEPG